MRREEYIVLVNKNLMRDISDIEFEQLNEITASHPELATLRLEIEDSWDAIGTNKGITSLAEQKAAKSTLTQKITSKKVIPFKKYRWISSIAALFVISLSAYLLLRPSDQRIFDAINNDLVITLTDNSIVKLRKGSQLVKNESQSKRHYTLKGEAFFEVKRNTSSPFIVETTHSKTEVLGTSFLVKQFGEGQDFLSVNSGRVKFTSSSTGESIVLEKGQTSQLKNDRPNLLPETNNLNAWNTGILKYEDVKLMTVISEISIINGDKIRLEKGELQFCKLSGVLLGKKTENLLNQIASQYDMILTFEDNEWILSEGFCTE